MKVLTCFFVVCSMSALSADWNYNKPTYDQSGLVQLKRIDGVVQNITNNNQGGLRSSASPTVLNVQVGGTLNIKHFTEFTVSLDPTEYYYNKVLPEAFDLSKSLVEVTVVRTGTVCARSGMECKTVSDGISHVVEFLSPSELLFTLGSRYGGSLIATAIYDVKVSELASGTVKRGRVNVPTCGVVEVPAADLKSDSPFFINFANGGAYSHDWTTSTRTSTSIGVRHRVLDGKVVFEAECSYGGQKEDVKVYYQYVV